MGSEGVPHLLESRFGPTSKLRYSGSVFSPMVTATPCICTMDLLTFPGTPQPPGASRDQFTQTRVTWGFRAQTPPGLRATSSALRSTVVFEQTRLVTGMREPLSPTANGLTSMSQSTRKNCGQMGLPCVDKGSAWPEGGGGGSRRGEHRELDARIAGVVFQADLPHEDRQRPLEGVVACDLDVVADEVQPPERCVGHQGLRQGVRACSDDRHVGHGHGAGRMCPVLRARFGRVCVTRACVRNKTKLRS